MCLLVVGQQILAKKANARRLVAPFIRAEADNIYFPFRLAPVEGGDAGAPLIGCRAKLKKKLREPFLFAP